MKRKLWSAYRFTGNGQKHINSNNPLVFNSVNKHYFCNKHGKNTAVAPLVLLLSVSALNDEPQDVSPKVDEPESC